MNDSPLLTDGRASQQSMGTGPVIALVVLVAAAYITIFIDAAEGQTQIDFTPLQIVIMICSGVVYTILVIYDERVYNLFPSVSMGQFFYFILQFGLVIALGVAAEAQGQWWLMILPVMGGSAAINLKWMVGTGIGAILAICAGYVITLNSLEPLWIVPIYITPAIVFVLIFSHITHRERESRLEIERLAVELHDANRKLSQYALKIEELAVIRERNRMARDIHDSLGHYLTVANVQIRAAQAVMATNPNKAQDALLKAQKLTEEGLAEVRQSVSALRDSPADSQPLTDTIQALIEESQAAGISTTFTITGAPRPLSTAMTRTLYRTTQEGLTNIRKHANAQNAAVVLNYTESDIINLLIQDDGQGASITEGGFGLLGMRERVRLLGGSVIINTAKDKGFQLEVRLPTNPLSQQKEKVI